MEDATAETAATAFGAVLNRVDAQRRLSLTYDQGREMAQHARLSEITGVAATRRGRRPWAGTGRVPGRWPQEFDSSSAKVAIFDTWPQ